MAFQRAERKRAWMKMALTGPSGSGKTYSALRLAFGLGKRVAVIDTENGSASLYADLGQYDVLEISPPFTVPKYREAIAEALAGGYDVLIIDSLTHAWAGEGGLLAQKEALDSRGGNQYTNWASITKLHEAFKASILQAPIHVVATMRSKTEYVVEQDQRGKSTPRKVGLAPIQRDGMEYEFTTVLDIALDHTAIPSKDRTGLFDGLNAVLTQEHGKTVAAWLASGATPSPAQVLPAAPESNGDRAASRPGPAPVVTQGLIRQLHGLYRRAGGDPQDAETLCSDLAAILKRPCVVVDELLPEDIEACVAALRAQADAAEPPPSEALVCSSPECGALLTKGQHDVSVRSFGSPMCPACQRKARVPA